jgi:hypothetical protein
MPSVAGHIQSPSIEICAKLACDFEVGQVCIAGFMTIPFDGHRRGACLSGHGYDWGSLPPKIKDVVVEPSDENKEENQKQTKDGDFLSMGFKW